MIQISKKQKDYELIDAGDAEKLERYGNVIIRRPDPQALFHKKMPIKVWEEAHCVFDKNSPSKWKIKKDVPDSFVIELEGLKFKIAPTVFKHTGVFPEQVPNWSWLRDRVKTQKTKFKDREVTVLNLFGYTGGASLALASAGASVCHVDASKPSIGWAKDNAKLSGLEEKPIRWILEDAMLFVKREERRGKKYDGIVMDPPSFGRGAKGEVWKIEEDFLTLINLTKKILSDDPAFFLINGYATGYSSLAYKENLEDLKQKFGGNIEYGELAIEASSGVVLPAGIFSRWAR